MTVISHIDLDGMVELYVILYYSTAYCLDLCNAISERVVGSGN